MKSAAFIDLDGTLLTKNTTPIFMKFLQSRGMLSRKNKLKLYIWYFQYKISAVDFKKVAFQVASATKGMDAILMEAMIRTWTKSYVFPLISKDGVHVIEKHRKKGDIIVILTGALEFMAKPIAEKLSIQHVISSKFEIEDSIFTGKPILPLCYGKGKAEYAKNFAKSNGILLENCFFYSDSYTDLDVFKMVGHPVAVNPDFRLRRAAKKYRWQIQIWK